MKTTFSEKVRTSFLFVVLFFVLPLAYLNGVQQPENSLKMLLAACGLGMFVGWGMLTGSVPGMLFSLRRWPVLAGMFYITWRVLGLLGSVDPGDAAVDVAHDILLFVILFVLIGLFTKPRQAERFCAGPSLLSLSVSVYGLVQLYFLRQASLAEGTPFVINFAVGASLGNKNSFAEILLLCLPFSAWCIGTNQRFRWMHILSFLLGCFLLFFLKSLATWLGLFAGSCFVVVSAGSRFLPSLKRYAVPLIVSLCILLVAGYVFRGRFMTDSIRQKIKNVPAMSGNADLFSHNSPANNNSAFERMLLWRNTGKMIAEAPWTGNGTGNWRIYLYKYGISGTDFISTGLVHYEHPHNDYLLAFAENGVFGMIFLLAFYFLLVREGIRKMKSSEDHSRWLYAAMTSVVIAFSVLSLFGYPWTKTVAGMLLMLAAAVILAEPASPNGMKRSTGPAFVHLLFVALLAWAGWIGYQRLRGEALMYQVQLAKYKQDWMKVLRILDRSRSVYFELDAVATPVEWYRGLAWYYQGNRDQAKVHFLKAAAIHPYHMQVFNDLGTVYEEEGNHREALDSYSRAAQALPFNIQAALNQCAVYYNLRRADSAYASIDRIYGGRIKGQDSLRYVRFLPLVLYAVAYSHLQTLPEDQRARLAEMLRSPQWLRQKYEEAKRKKISFIKVLEDERI